MRLVPGFVGAGLPVDGKQTLFSTVCVRDALSNRATEGCLDSIEDCS